MNNIYFNKAFIRFNDSFSLLDINWRIEPGQVWAIMGSSGSGKSALAAALAGHGVVEAGSVSGTFANTAVVSTHTQAEKTEDPGF